MKIHYINFEFSKIARDLKTKIELSNADANSNTFVIGCNFSDKNIVKEDTKAYVNLLLPSGDRKTRIEAKIEDGKVVYLPAEAEVDEVGVYKIDVTLIDGASRQTSPKAIFKVIDSIEE